MKKDKSSHLGSGHAAGEFATPQLYDSSPERKVPSDNIQNERDGEHRTYDTIPKAVQVPSDVFHQEASGDAHRMITPSAAGIPAPKTEAPSYSEGQASTPSNPNRQFKRKFDQ